MRSWPVFGLLLVLAGICLNGISAAQDTNFSSGPQYLMNYGSPLLFQPLTTPTLSLSSPLPSLNGLAEEGSGEPSSPALGGLQNQAQINRVYYGVSPTAGESAPSAQTETSEPVAANPSEIELSSAEPRAPLPSSILNVGVTGIADAQSLRDSGYGATLGEVAAFWKAKNSHASRIYTNADIARLHGG